MKKSKAALLSLLLILLISVTIYFLSVNGFLGSGNKPVDQSETNIVQDKEDIIEKHKNTPDPTTANNEATALPEEDKEVSEADAVEITSDDEVKTEKQTETIFEKIIYKIEDDVKTASNMQEAESTATGTSQAAAGSFWDEPLVQSVYSRFSSSEIALAMRAASGNATSAEKKAVKDMVYGRVSASEIAELQRLYALHGGK